MDILTELGGFYIFPNEFKPENFNQGNAGLCFFFSSLASILGVPGLIHQLFGNINNWNKTKQFIVYLFYKKKRKELMINDKFPFYNVNYFGYDKIPWIWSIPAHKELFAKIMEKAYIKYQMIYGTYVKQYNQILDKIYHIIYDGGNERDSMKILINSKSKLIYSSEKYNLFDSEQIFQEIKYYLEEEKGLVTLVRVFDGNQKELHSYSVIGAWNFCQGKSKKKSYVLKILGFMEIMIKKILTLILLIIH